MCRTGENHKWSTKPREVQQVKYGGTHTGERRGARTRENTRERASAGIPAKPQYERARREEDNISVYFLLNSAIPSSVK